MIRLHKEVIKWGNSAGIYVPREHIGKWASVQILEEPRLSERYVYGAVISMECYGYALLKPDNFAPELRSPAELKGFNLSNYAGEEIRIMLPEDIILELIEKSPDFRLIKGIPVILRNYKKGVDFGYLMAKAQQAGKLEFLGYILEAGLKILSKHKVRNDLQAELKSAIKRIKAAATKDAKIKFPSAELERIYWRTENREAIEATKRDSLMGKWNIAYVPKEKEFEETFRLYVMKD